MRPLGLKALVDCGGLTRRFSDVMELNSRSAALPRHLHAFLFFRSLLGLESGPKRLLSKIGIQNRPASCRCSVTILCLGACRTKMSDQKKVSGNHLFAFYSVRTRIIRGCQVGIGWRKKFRPYRAKLIQTKELRELICARSS